MEDLLGALLQGSQAGPGQSAGEGEADPLSLLLQGMAGGQTGSSQSAGESGANPLSLLLQGMAGGQAGSSQSAGESGANPLSLLLQGMAGGQGGYSGTSQATASGGGGLGNILGALLGGSSSGLQSNSLLTPIVNGLAEKLNLPPQLAQAIVVFVLGKLLSNRQAPAITETQAYTQPSTAPAQGASLQDVVQQMNRGQQPSTTPAQGANLENVVQQMNRGQRASTTPSRATKLDNVVQRMNSGQRVRKADIRGTGITREIVAQTGLDRATAEASVQEVLNALAGQMGTMQ